MKRLFSITTIFVLAITLLTAYSGKKNSTPSGNSVTTTQNAASTSAPTAGKWPDNEYAKLLPQPSAGTIGASRAKNDDYFEGISISDMTWNEAQEYVKELKTAGFTEKIDEFGDWDSKGYRYYAEKANGGGVYVNFTNGAIAVGKDK